MKEDIEKHHFEVGISCPNFRDILKIIFIIALNRMQCNLDYPNFLGPLIWVRIIYSLDNRGHVKYTCHYPQTVGPTKSLRIHIFLRGTPL